MKNSHRNESLGMEIIVKPHTTYHAKMTVILNNNKKKV